MNAQRYLITETLFRDSRKVLQRARREADNQGVILKSLDPRHCGPNDVKRLYNEYEIGISLNIKSVLRPLAYETYEGMPLLVFEDYGDQSLDEVVVGPMATKEFLELAIRIADAVASLHQQGIVHKNLKLENIFIHPSTLEVKIAGLGLATRLSRRQQVVWPSQPQLIEGSLPYLSPEQTGRLNRAIDKRTDLYSLGVTFYWMLTGRFPFEARDPLEWVHCHVARVPVSPRELVPEVSEAIAQMVMKLLAKMAEDRYQTARGLQYDLVRSLEQWRAKGRIDLFPLGERDLSDRLQIPQKLFGRERHNATLLAASERVASTGVSELVLVSGYSGIGKSSLVHGIEEQLVGKNWLFIEGKFDRYKRDFPYFTIIQAFRSLVLNITLEGEERISKWRARLQAALGAEGQLVVDVIPQLEDLIGRQPPVSELPATEAQHRFHFVLRRFLGVFAQKEHPLVLFVDDLQWADPASLALLESLVANSNVRFLLVVGAYRNNEVTSIHPLTLAQDRMRKTGVRISDLEVGPLTSDHLTAFIAETLHQPAGEVKSLAELVLDKTGANPFFVVQFLDTLEREALIAFDHTIWRWCWDLARIKAQGYTDNVIELMVGKLRHLPEKTQKILEVAACLGIAFDIKMLEAVYPYEPEPILRAAVEKNLLFSIEHGYQFAHDRVQEAAYSLIPEGERPAAHLSIGRLLLASLPESTVVEHIFECVNQLNRGIELITDPSEREKVQYWNAQAGRRAKKAIAFVSARNYLNQAVALLRPDAWQAKYEDTFNLQFELSECEYLAGHFAAGERLSGQILKNSRSHFDRALVYRLRIRMNEMAGRNDEAMAMARLALQLFNISVPESDKEIRTMIETENREVFVNLRGRFIAELANAPLATDPSIQTIVSVIADSLSPAYMARQDYFPLFAAKGVNVCLRHGNAGESSSIYNSYALVLAGVGDFQIAFDFSEVALHLLEKVHNPRARGVLFFRHGLFVNHWRNHIATGLPYLTQSASASLAAGDLLYAGYAYFGEVETSIEKGDYLDQVLQAAQKYAEFAKQTHSDAVSDTLQVQQQFVACLKGLTREPGSFDDKGFSEACQVAGFAIWRYYVLKQVVSLLYDRYDEALEYAELAAKSLSGMVALMLVATHHFYRALTLAAVYRRATSSRKNELKQSLTDELYLHRQWAENCPENFGNRYALVAAEVASIEGQEFEAMRLYDQASRSARENGFIQNEALAYERASIFYRERGFNLIADTYLREARGCYLRWGADGKVKQLERLYPQLVDWQPIAATATLAVRAEQLDLLSVVKASQTISGEILFENLVGTLLKMVLEQGSADHAWLILARGDEIFMEAEAVAQDGGVSTRLLASQPLMATRNQTTPAQLNGPVSDSSPIPVSLIQYANRTRKPVILSDSELKRFSSDSYFAHHKPRSVLCLPILRQADLLGLIYLENNFAADAFTPDRLTALTLLASQSAISMENALLLAQERAARTAVEQAKVRVEEAISLRDEFLSTASHELRTPIQSLQLAIQFLERSSKERGGASSQMLGIAIRQTERLAALVNQLIDVVRVRTGRLTLMLEKFDLVAYVRLILERMQIQIEHTESSVCLHADGVVTVHWDRSRIDQLITNLLSNALTYGEGKPIDVTVEQPGANGYVGISVRDHGTGIPGDRLPHIFERFERASSTHHYGGLGLGLYIANQIAQSHGGTISVASELGRGSSFTVVLPVEPVLAPSDS